MVHILIVDDDPAIREILRQGLEAEGITAWEAANKSALFRALETKPVDLVTLDLGLGKVEGLDLAREIRATRNVPIIMITGRSEPIDRVIGLEHGADDYISKPFHIREVVMRIRNVLERYQLKPRGLTASDAPREGTEQQYAFDHAVLDVLRREVKKIDGSLVDLTETEFRLLEMFVRYPARVLSRDEILQQLRDRDWSPYDRTIDGHVARLRRKIEPLGEAPMLIKSVRGVGYVFTGEVRPI